MNVLLNVFGLNMLLRSITSSIISDDYYSHIRGWIVVPQMKEKLWQICHTFSYYRANMMRTTGSGEAGGAAEVS